MPLSIQNRKVSDVIILDLAGKHWILDLPLRDRMNTLLAEGSRNFVLNVAGVEYIDSSGLGQIVTIWTSILGRGGRLTILNPTKPFQTLLKITSLDSVFQISTDEAGAIQFAGASNGS